ncbi:hypothetical protein DID88_003365 [Monilinia fructigena]|uniref:Vacuolar protein sorting-associated protein 26 n=1 Tax=Monilinia fructigena TaxID=38457 RepID=A0A395IVK0_9HELO|nr:hypothetical protein DID88_003365 [Monilinia fructigena]
MQQTNMRDKDCPLASSRRNNTPAPGPPHEPLQGAPTRAAPNHLVPLNRLAANPLTLQNCDSYYTCGREDCKLLPLVDNLPSTKPQVPPFTNRLTLGLARRLRFNGVIVDEIDKKPFRINTSPESKFFVDELERRQKEQRNQIRSISAAYTTAQSRRGHTSSSGPEVQSSEDKTAVKPVLARPKLEAYSKVDYSTRIEFAGGVPIDFVAQGLLFDAANSEELPPVDIDIVLEDGDSRETVEVKNKSSKERVPLYKDGESVRGAVTIRPKDGKRLEHTGIKVQFIGMIEMFYDRGNHYEFLSLGQELAAPGDLQHPQAYDFNFKNVEKQVTVSRRMADVIREKDLWVFSYRIPPEMNSSIKMDVGIEDCLHIEFEYSKSKYHLKDVIVGRIYFLLVRLKIKHMELSIIRRETTGTPPNQYNESETLVRFEIMDGSPSRGETIPIRLFLGGFDLTPTFREVNKKYSTRYYLSLVLIDEDARRYFKQSEIVLYRQQPEDALALGQQTKIAGAHSAPSPAAQKRIAA